GVGAAWVWTRSGSTWTQQGSKLVGTGSVGGAGQGSSVAISADGNTAIIGGVSDNSFQGAAWVWTRSGSTWTQQGGKLVGTGNVGTAQQGYSVSLSADGNTAIVGGNNDNSGVGASWIWTRNGSTWTQQGSKLLGGGYVGNGNQGYSVSLSADGNTGLVGAYNDNVSQGAVWAFTPGTAPILSNFSPTGGSFGSVITLSGGNFLGVNSVSFGGITASSFVVVNSTTITAVIGVGASGVVSVASGCGTATLGGFTFTPPGAALDFDGTNDYVDISPVIPFTNDFTIEAWIKTSQTSGVIFAWGDPVVNNYTTFEVYFNRLRLTSGMGGSLDYSDGATVVTSGLWTHVAVTRSGNQINLYVNGFLDGTYTSTNRSYPSTSSIGAGLLNNIIQNYFKGSIDALRIWNRPLCQSEINNNRLFENPANTSGLVAKYNFNQGFAMASNPGVTTLIDNQSIYNGSLTGFALSGSQSNWISPGGVPTGSVSSFFNNSTSAIITGISPSVASTGQSVTISGLNFTGSDNVSAVYFGTTPAASFTVPNSTKV
ncbi:MAG: IPT/TIG domain-containing protein, partial [Cytophagales bacterium]|nr:IPT/TIG domain-containing protein [Cytophagales bacterium]